jgi:chitodextrinase
VSGLAASTSYSFSIGATDAAGTSTASSPLNVTTLSNGGGTCATAWSATAAYAQGMTLLAAKRCAAQIKLVSDSLDPPALVSSFVF